MITIDLQPQPISPVYNEIILALDSDKKSEPLFQFIVNIKINGTPQSRMPISANLQGFAVVDMHKHIEPFVTYNIDHDETTLFTQTPDAFTKYSVSLDESYRIDHVGATATDSGGTVTWSSTTEHHLVIGDKIAVSNSTVAAYDGISTVASVPSTTQIVTNKVYSSDATGDYVIFDNSATIITGTTVITGSTYAFNGDLSWRDVPSFQTSAYTTDHQDTLMLTTAPDNYAVRRDDRVWFNFYNIASPLTSSVDFLRIFTYNSSGTLTGNYAVSNGFLADADANRFLNVGVGPWNLINTPSGSTSVASGTLPIIGSADTSYEVHLLNTSNGRISKSYTFNINDDCTRFEVFRLIYLDKLGSFLNVNFDLANKKTIKNKKRTYQQNYGAYNPATKTWGYDTWDRGKTHLDSDITETYRVTTNWITEDMGDMVADLILSPEVYHLDEDGNLFAINITTNSLKVKQRAIDKLINYSINFEYSNKNTVQRG